MAEREIIALNESTPQLEAAQSGDTYVAVRATRFAQDIVMSENADHSSTPAAGFGYLWTKNTAPTTLIFTNDDGTDLTLATGGGDLLADGTVPLTADWDVGAFTITGTQFISDIATGTAPFVVASTTVVANLKAATAGNADTVTTNANLTGHVTSTGNAAILGTFTLAQLNAAVSDATIEDFKNRDIAFSDETGDLTTGDNKATFHMPNYATTLLEVSIGVTTAPTGSTAIFDLTEAGTTVLSTLISIDAGEKTSEDAATPPVISDSSLAANALMSVNIDQIGSSVAGAGAKLYVKYKRA